MEERLIANAALVDVCGMLIRPAYDPSVGDFVLVGFRNTRVYGIQQLNELWQFDPAMVKEIVLAGGGVFSSLCNDYVARNTERSL